MKKRIVRLCGYIAVAAVGATYGVMVDRFHLPPYYLARAAYQALAPKKPAEPPREFIETPKEYFETDVDALISIRQPQDVPLFRDKLIAMLWGTPQLPSLLPSRVVGQFSDTRYDDVPSLVRIDELTVVMDFGLESHVYHFTPKNPNNNVILYHQGHRGDFINSKEQIATFLDRGYAIAAFCMPLLGLNNQPTVTLPRFGRFKLTAHDHMKFLSPESGHPVKYFVEPVEAVLNYLERNFDYSSVSMVGISGGAWTTTLAAAVDPRIGKSFPVAGTFPMYLRSNSKRDWGDFEQTAPVIYNATNYLELYVLGSLGPNRGQLQIVNQYDPCCFAGTKWETYRDVVKAHVQVLGGGDFDLFFDDSHAQHTISPLAMSRILDVIGKADR